MQLTRRIAAGDPKLFGRGPRRELAAPRTPDTLGDDVRLFVTTFLAGFIFVSLLIA
jgi:hypothetical protein